MIKDARENVINHAFSDRRAGVIRGRVVSADGYPLIGVEVKVQDENHQSTEYGSVKTRADGW